MTTDTQSFTASDGKSLALHRWLPEGKPKGVIQIAHGMMEFARRYDLFAQRAAERGWAVIAHDARGHGETAGNLEALGHLDEAGGFERSVEDLREITLSIGTEWPLLPIVLLGHSYGSFLSQMYIERHGDLVAACALSGTRGPDPLEVAGGRFLAGLMAALGMRSRRSPLLFTMSFAPNNGRIANPQSPNAWLSSDGEEVARYDASPWCGFMPTVGFWSNLMKGLSVIHRREEIEGIPKDLPLLLFAGSEDPVGKYGKTIDGLEKLYRRAGIRDLTRKTWEGGRHEMFQEMRREEAIAHVLDWMEDRVGSRARFH